MASAEGGTQGRVICPKRQGRGFALGCEPVPGISQGWVLGSVSASPRSMDTIPCRRLWCWVKHREVSGSVQEALEMVPLLPSLRFKDQVISESCCKWKNAHKGKKTRWVGEWVLNARAAAMHQSPWVPSQFALFAPFGA